MRKLFGPKGLNTLRREWFKDSIVLCNQGQEFIRELL